MQETQTPPFAPARRAKFWIGGAVIVAVLAALILWAMTQPGAASNYISPSDLTASSAGTEGTELLRLAGTVVPDSIERDGLTTTFLVTDETTEVEVTTDSPLPDAFKDSSEVVATGTYDGTSFTASNVLAKCPSKFKAKV
jgi:cytochrome c-type biogenesis protein CcmE